jgi:steroid 5-alpha reductase family enzyme
MLVPTVYILGLVSGNVSWVDRSWPFYTPLCSGLIVLWAVSNPTAAVYGHNIPRLTLMMVLQLTWSARLVRHAIRRGFYDLRGEDYRYTTLRKIVPTWFFQLLHPFVIAFAQPVLLLSLALPMHAVITLPPAELSAEPIPALTIPFRAVMPFLPTRFHSADPSVPVLNLADFALTVIAFGLLYIEYKADETMHAYQSAKHSTTTDLVQPPIQSQPIPADWPKPMPYPHSFHPGFPVDGMYKWSRHPNFAAEQLFWLTQALFVVGAGESSGVTRTGWVGGSIFAGAFSVSSQIPYSCLVTECRAYGPS